MATFKVAYTYGAAYFGLANTGAGVCTFVW